jgi:hypothetical protein
MTAPHSVAAQEILLIMKNIEFSVFLPGADEPTTVTVPENATVAALLGILGLKKCRVFVGEETAPRDEKTKLHDLPGGAEVRIVPEEIHYTVDGEAQTTNQPNLTTTQILEKAEVDAATHYLILLKANGQQQSFKDQPNKVVHIKEGMEFLTASTGSTPVS